MSSHGGNTEWCSRKQNVRKSMEILEDVQNNYRNKLRQLNYFGTKKKVIQLKFEIFQDWIRYLQEENKLLAQLVIDLEEDVLKDVESLKNKPESSGSCESRLVQIKDENFNELQKYKSDLMNVLIFLEAIRLNQADSLNLEFYFVKHEDLFGNPPIKYSSRVDESAIKSLREDKKKLQKRNDELQLELKKKDKVLQEREEKIFQLEKRLEEQERFYKDELQKHKKKFTDSFERLISVKQSNVWEASKEVTNNMIQIWDKLVDKKLCEDKSTSNCHVVMDKNDNALDSLQQAVNQITRELQAQGTISKHSQGDALLFIVFDKNKNS